MYVWYIVLSNTSYNDGTYYTIHHSSHRKLTLMQFCDIQEMILGYFCHIIWHRHTYIVFTNDTKEIKGKEIRCVSVCIAYLYSNETNLLFRNCQTFTQMTEPKLIYWSHTGFMNKVHLCLPLQTSVIMSIIFTCMVNIRWINMFLWADYYWL